jgi:hypothetical protein
MAKLSKISNLYPAKYWTPVKNEVLLKSLGKLSSNADAVVFLVLYDRIWHRETKTISASVADIARWTKLDPRTVELSLSRLIKAQYLDCERLGTARSRTDKPRWTLPTISNFKWKDGGWTPVPRFIFQDYIPRYKKSVLIPILIYHQQLGWRNDAWPGMETLSRITGWSKRSVYEALYVMSKEKEWEKVKSDLPVPPLPLQITESYKHGRNLRHYRVLALYYHRPDSDKKRCVSLSKPFEKCYGIARLRKPQVFWMQE